MFRYAHVAETATTINLKRLFILRNLVIIGQVLLVSFAVFYLRMALPLLPIITVLLISAGLNIYAGRQLRRGAQIGPRRFFLHVIADVITLSAFLYYTGGATNPFVSLLLLPLVIIATTQPKEYTWVMALFTVACYSILMVLHVPLPDVSHGHDGGFNLHIIGMWISYLVGASLIVTFVVRMAETLRRLDASLARTRERLLEDESLVALGTLAAGAAHELSTPLATIKLVAEEIEHDCAATPDLVQHTKMLHDQVARCKIILSRMSGRVDTPGMNKDNRQTIEEFLNNTIMNWQNMRPQCEVKLHFPAVGNAIPVRTDIALAQAIISLLNNAADASPRSIEVIAEWNEQALILEIRDSGPGLVGVDEQLLARPYFTTKEDGQGLGLFLARAVIERLGGSLEISNRQNGGVSAQVRLPIENLSINQEIGRVGQ